MIRITRGRPLLALAGFAAILLALGAGPREGSDVPDMARAADGFLASLTPDQRARAVFGLDSDERERFNFLPVEAVPRSGISIGELDQAAREALHRLLRTGLSQRGYLTATQVMELEDVLRALEQGGRLARDPNDYFLSVFGTPSTEASWAWRFEGHHLSLNFTVVGGTVAVAAPSFVGASPAEVREGPQEGRRVLGDREDAGRALVTMLDAAQRSVAVIDVEAPQDILTGAASVVEPLPSVGLRAADMTAPQRAALMDLIDVYLDMASADVAAFRRERLVGSGVDEIRFAWAGGLEAGQPHYYRVQGPTFLIEYDNTQNGANHIHSVWRDFDGDFGRDLLREHRELHPHD